MEAVAREMLGDPNPRHTTPNELRYGSNGSLSIDRAAGIWFDHERQIGGGVLDLLKDRQGLQNGSALDWLRERGFLPQRDAPSAPAERARIVQTYDYVDENGEVVFQVVRFEPKTFRQRRPARQGGDSRDGWVWSVKGLTLVPYRLIEVQEAIANGHLVMIVEGEKDADALWMRGIPATCNPMGAGKWSPDMDRHFVGADVVILPDNDDAGRKHRDVVSARLASVATRVRSLDLPNLPAKGDVSDWLDAGGSAEELYHLIENGARVPGDVPPASRYGALWLDAIPGSGNTAPWIVKGIVPGGGFGAVVGPPGCGKSFLTLDLGFTVSVLAITEGEDARWFGRRVRPVGVVYIAAEGTGGFSKRVEALIKRFRVGDLGRYPFVLYPTSLDLRNPEADTGPLGEELKAISARMMARMGVPLGLVIVDTLNRVLAGGDENSSEDMGAFIRNCGRLQEVAGGCTVVPVHHMNAAGTRERGHSSLRGALDFMIEVEHTDAGNSWKVAKQKDDSDGQTFAFSLTSEPIGIDEDGDAITSCLVEPVEAPKIGPQTRRSKLPPQALNAYGILFRHCEDSGQRRQIFGRPEVAVTIATWQAECRRQNLVAPGSGDDAFRKAFQRSFDTLRADKRIGVDGDFVFPILRKCDSS
jgi:hypothetical protein